MSSGSSSPASRVESARSVNITVRWRRWSAAGPAAGAGASSRRAPQPAQKRSSYRAPRPHRAQARATMAAPQPPQNAASAALSRPQWPHRTWVGDEIGIGGSVAMRRA